MSCISRFMEALEQASHPQRPPEAKTVQQGHGYSNQSTLRLPESSSASGDAVQNQVVDAAGLLHPKAVITAATIHRKVTADVHLDESQPTSQTLCRKPISHSSGIDVLLSQSTLRPAAGDPITRPQLSARDSLDDLFSDSESDQDDMLNNKTNNVDTAEQTRASIGKPFSMRAGVRPYDPNASTKEINAQQDLGSPQVSPATPFYPHQQPSLMKIHSKDQGFEIQSALSEEDQIAHFSDKAFRRALREVEPSLSKGQQYYAWRNAYQNTHEERPSGLIGPTDSNEGAATPDQNPPYRLEMEPVGYLDGVPTFAGINTTTTMYEIDDKVEHIKSDGYDSSGTLSQEEEFEAETGERSKSDAKSEDVRPFNPFLTHHDIAASTAPRADMAKRERMLESSFSDALEALEKDNTERITRESEADEAHLRSLHTLSKPRTWALDVGNGERTNEEHPHGSSLQAKEREGSPEPEPMEVQIGEHNHVGPPKINHDESSVTAFVSPDKQRSESETMSSIQAKMADDHRQQYAQHHDHAEEEESMSPSERIPGLDHLHPQLPSNGCEASVPAPPCTPVSPTSHRLDRDIRKSIEPETPRHLLNRECTPAFEDRSPTPSPRSLSNDHSDGDSDMVMEEASPLPPVSHQYNHHHQSSNIRDSSKPTVPVSTSSSPDPISSPRHPEPPLQPLSQQKQELQDQNQVQPTMGSTKGAPRPRTPSQSLSHSPTKPHQSPIRLHAPSSAAAAATHRSDNKSTHQRPSDRTRTNRRKSAILGNSTRVGKPPSKTATPRSKSRKVAANTTATDTTPTAVGQKPAVQIKEEESMVRTLGDGAKDKNKVREAVERIEASVRVVEMENGGGRERASGTRRSRRLMEKRETTTSTPEPE